MGMLMNFDQRDVAEALELLMHMMNMAAEGRQPSGEDQERVRELCRKIRASRR